MACIDSFHPLRRRRSLDLRLMMRRHQTDGAVATSGDIRLNGKLAHAYATVAVLTGPERHRRSVSWKAPMVEETSTAGMTRAAPHIFCCRITACAGAPARD